jgi:D-methionine transport system substrate-binding protein
MKFRKVLALTAALAVSATVYAGTTASAKTLTTITVGASPSPHAVILAYIKPQLKALGYNLKIVNFDDYVLPNKALTDKSLDANYFQHQPYLTDYNTKNKTNIVSAGAIHYEPLGIYAGKAKSLSALQSGATIAVPNDTTNEARALLLLQDNKLITIKKGKGIDATVKDIATNPKNLNFKELDAAQIARSLNDVDLGVINGNYALSAGLSISNALAKESATSVAAKTYANIIAVRKGDQNRPEIKSLVKVLKSAATKAWITKKFKGAVLPVN